MALFRKKPSEPDDGAAANGAPGAPASTFEPQPEKARKWFDHAKTMADSYNYDAAISYYASGIKLDPEAMSAHEAMFDAAIQHFNKGGKPASGKEIKSILDTDEVSKMAAAEFAWMREITNGALGLKFIEAAVKADLIEIAHTFAGRVLNSLRKSRKISKAQLLTAKEKFAAARAWDEAVIAGSLALQLDPTDNDLANELKDISAQRAMDQGGYEDATKEEGGFRRMIKDVQRQHELIEAEAISTNLSAEERNFSRAKAEYEAAPSIPEVISRYAQLLKKKGTPDAEEEAFKVYMKGFEDIKEYRFRMAAGDIRINRLQRRVDALEEKLAASPDDAELQSKLETTREELLKVQSDEFQERVVKYPTDRFLKYQLGEVEYALGRYEDAMGCFQNAKDEPKLRVRAAHQLGKSFAKESWHTEAIGEFREALANIDATEAERELHIRYDLMLSLLEHAKQEQSTELAKEALEICSIIARKNISFRDIRAKRKEVDELIKQLSSPA